MRPLSKMRGNVGMNSDLQESGMTKSWRLALHIASALALSACGAAPPVEREAVAVKADTLTPEYSSFNARVLSEAGAVEHSFAASLDPTVETVTRLESAYTHQVGSDEQQRLRVGDTISSAGMWGSSVRYAGMQFGTRTGARADVIAAPRLATSGLAVLPTVEDALFASVGDRSTSLADQNVSIGGGAGEGPWSLVAQDALGRSQSIAAPMIASTRLVTAGCSDFSVGLGKVRRDYALLSNEYGPMFANTTVACAAPLGFTVEGHGEYLADDVAALGLGLARQVGPIGTASVAVASSRTESGSGWLARFGFEHSNSLFNVAVRSHIQSREFREIGTAALADPIMQRELASVGLNVTDRANLALAYATQTTWERERINLIALKQSVSVGRGALSMSAGHSFADNFGSSLFISYKRPLGGRAPARALVQEFDLEAFDALAVPQ
jgi:outer membrane usher protein FimD/PapC